MSSDVIAFLVVLVLIALGIGVATRRSARLPPKKAEEPLEGGERAKALPRRAAEPEPVAEEPVAEEEEEEQGEEEAEPAQLGALRGGLEKTRGGFVAKLGALFSRKQIDAGIFDQLEEVLYTADIGVKTSQKLFGDLKRDLGRNQLADASAIWPHLKDLSRKLLDTGAPPLDLERARPFVVLVIGVNGAGKTTTIGKLAARYVGQGKKVLLAAGDTFRAAATEQLEVWGKRVGAPVVRGKEGGDPSSVVFDAVKRAQAEGYDLVLADTAGRLHTKTELMAELDKVRRVTGKAMDGAPHETWLVLDATMGQNAIAQAEIFQEATKASGIILTKLDGTAKGGVILGISDQLGVPVRFIGIGEKVDDLKEFDADDFVEALFTPPDEAVVGSQRAQS